LYGAPTDKNKVWAGLAYSVATPLGLRGRPEVGPDFSHGAEMVEAGGGQKCRPHPRIRFRPPICCKTYKQLPRTIQIMKHLETSHRMILPQTLHY